MRFTRGKSSLVAYGNRVEWWTARVAVANQRVYIIVSNLSEKEEDDLPRMEETNTNTDTPSKEKFMMNVLTQMNEI